jgi:hypothetical protein
VQWILSAKLNGISRKNGPTIRTPKHNGPNLDHGTTKTLCVNSSVLMTAT